MKTPTKIQQVIKRLGNTLFLDADKVMCVGVEDAKFLYPDLNWFKVAKRFSWDLHGKLVMAVKDLHIALHVENQNRFTDMDYMAITHCAVCGLLLDEDDEAYDDLKNKGRGLCTSHSKWNEDLQGYVASKKILPFM